MKVSTTRLFISLLLTFAVSAFAWGQVSSTGSLSGTVQDPKGAVVTGATVVVKDKATGVERTTQTNGEGNFRVPALSSGVYVATVTAAGFKQANVTDIKIDVGTPTSINVELEVGAQTEQVTIVGGGEILKTESANVGTTLIGRQITDIPTASRDALDLVLALPGTTTPGRPRTSSVNGLPKGGLNITLDGINVQDNLLKSSDGFFTYIRPRTDAVSEVTVSTSNPGAESSGEGAVQIKFATQGGSNQYHGGLYWYHRNPALNTNYYFNNRNLPADPVTGKAPQNRILLNQPGGKIGGPISIPKLFSGKDKAFFFINYEEFRLPERTSRTKTILSPQAQAGTHRFFASTAFVPPATTTCVAAPNPNTGAAGQLCSTNVLTLGASSGLAFGTVDPTIGPLLASIRSSLSGALIQETGDPNLQTATFINSGGQTRKFPTTRLDFNVTKNHHVETIWNYQQFRSTVDFLNGVDPAFPGFPNFGSQDSNRFSFVNAWRWTIKNNMVNEARYGVTGGTSLFFSQVNSGQFQNQGGFNQGIGAFGISSATVVTGPSRRNSPVKQFTDTLSYVKGNHQMNFGFSFTQIELWSQALTAVPSTVFTTSAQLDAAGFNAFSSLASGGVQNSAATLYNVLAGRLTAINGNARLSEVTNQYTFLGDLVSRAQQREWGIFAQDTWRFRPNITLTYGLRYEVQLPFRAKNNTYAGATFADLFGESGQGNLFRPGGLVSTPTAIVNGVCTGCQTTYTQFADGSQAYNTNYNNFAPSVGFTYSPNFSKGFINKIFGNSGQTVLRGGFSIAYIREGTNTFQSILGANPGGFLTANRSLTLGNLPVGSYLRQGPFAPPAFPATPVYPNSGLVTDSVNSFDPNIKIGYVQSWTAGIQRELSPSMALEIRYVGNRGKKLWRQYNLNEVNVIENGFIDEFRLAQQNLLANIAANRCQSGVTAAGCSINFAYFGPGTGTSPLPIISRYFGGSVDPALTASYASANFRAAAFFNTLNPLAPSPTGFAGTLAGVAFNPRRLPTVVGGNTVAPLFPFNHFLVNQGKLGGAFILDNGAASWYDGLTIELRRRLARGLLVQSSFTFSKALGNTYASSSVAFDQYATLRNPRLRRGVVPFDITSAFKTNFIYELPVGKGRALLGDSSGWLNNLVGGWGVNGNIRIQSGTPFQIGNVQLVGMTQKELQDSIGIYREADGFIYALPADIRQNTFRANNIALNTTGAVYTQGTPTGRYIAPAAAGNCLQAFSGGCGLQNLVLKGPAFFRSDLSVVKRIKFTETTNFEMRGEFLNAFNNINFLVGNAANDVNTLGGLNTAAFGRITSAYQDLSTTNDPGGRLVQLVLRLNF